MLLTGCLALVGLAVAGCGSSSNSGSSNAGTHGSASAGKKVTVGLVLPIVGWWFYADMLKGAEAMKQQLAKENVSLLIEASPGATVAGLAQYLPAIDRMVVQHPNVIVAENAGPTTVAPLLRGQQQGIKLVLTDGLLPGLNVSSVVGTANRAASKAGVTEWIKPLGAKATIGYLTVPGPGPVAERIAGANEAIAGTGVKVVSQLVGKCDVVTSTNDVETMVRTHPNIDAIYAPCGGGAQGAARGKQLLGAAGKHVAIWGFDGSPPEINYAKSGLIAGDLAQRPFTIAQKAIRDAVEIARGKQVPSTINVPYNIVTAANAHEF